MPKILPFALGLLGKRRHQYINITSSQLSSPYASLGECFDTALRVSHELWALIQAIPHQNCTNLQVNLRTKYKFIVASKPSLIFNDLFPDAI